MTTDEPAGYPTRWPVIQLECGNSKCRIEIYTGLVVHPLNCCPLCMREGSAVPPEGTQP